MRPIAIHQTALRAAQRELEQARDDLTSAVAAVQHPADDFPKRDLLVEGVRTLLEGATTVARQCRGLASGLDDSIVDFDDLDGFIATAAAIDKVEPR